MRTYPEIFRNYIRGFAQLNWIPAFVYLYLTPKQSLPAVETSGPFSTVCPKKYSRTARDLLYIVVVLVQISCNPILHGFWLGTIIELTSTSGTTLSPHPHTRRRGIWKNA